MSTRTRPHRHEVPPRPAGRPTTSAARLKAAIDDLVAIQNQQRSLDARRSRVEGQARALAASLFGGAPGSARASEPVVERGRCTAKTPPLASAPAESVPSMVRRVVTTHGPMSAEDVEIAVRRIDPSAAPKNISSTLYRLSLPTGPLVKTGRRGSYTYVAKAMLRPVEYAKDGASPAPNPGGAPV